MKKILIFLLLLSCSIPEKGTYIFRANGEDIVREGFHSREGWFLNFEHLYVNINSPRAFHPEDKTLNIILEGEHWVDLTEKTLPLVGKITNAKAGNYQALAFGLKKRTKSPYKGHSIVIIGNARKEDRTIPFEILLNEELLFTGTEGYVGDEIKGILPARGETEGEMTFHFDHIFGDQSASLESHINTDSPGFIAFLDFENEGKILVTQEDMKNSPYYIKLIKAIWTLGHLGEGHCDVSGQSTLLSPGELN